MVENLSLSKGYGDIQHTPDIKKAKKTPQKQTGNEL